MNPTQEINPLSEIKTVEQQLTYPLDLVTQNVLRDFLGTTQGFPINSIFTSTDSANPATALGYGTWTAFGAGKVLVGYSAGDPDFGTGGGTGGEKTHTLSTAEMPAHTHGSNLWQANGGSGNVGAGGGFDQGSTSSTGGGGSHNNLQPFIVVYFWKRTA